MKPLSDLQLQVLRRLRNRAEGVGKVHVRHYGDWPLATLRGLARRGLVRFEEASARYVITDAGREFVAAEDRAMTFRAMDRDSDNAGGPESRGDFTPAPAAPAGTFSTGGTHAS